jgi:hypothetical protein
MVNSAFTLMNALSVQAGILTGGAGGWLPFLTQRLLT